MSIRHYYFNPWNTRRKAVNDTTSLVTAYTFNGENTVQYDEVNGSKREDNYSNNNYAAYFFYFYLNWHKMFANFYSLNYANKQNKVWPYYGLSGPFHPNLWRSEVVDLIRLKIYWWQIGLRQELVVFALGLY